MTDLLALDVLVIDDEKNIRTTLSICLDGLGCRVSAAANAEAARAALATRPFDLAFLDLRLGETNGLDLLPELIAGRPRLAVVVISAQDGDRHRGGGDASRGRRLPSEAVHAGADPRRGRTGRRTSARGATARRY